MSKLKATALDYLRDTHVVSKMKRMRNSGIRKELGSEDTNKAIENKQLQTLEYLMRIHENRQVMKIWETKITGWRGYVRPKKKWDKPIQQISEERKITQKHKKEDKMAHHNKKKLQLMAT